MSYLLKQYNTPLLGFDYIETIDNIKVEIIKNYNRDALLPLDCVPTDESLLRWLKKRSIPRTRAYAGNFLARNGLNEKDIKGILDVCKGFSLNDSYWVVDSNFDGLFEDYNLYDNNFSRVLS